MNIRSILRSIIRFLVIWFVDALTFLLTIWILPGFTFTPTSTETPLMMASAAALLLGAVNFIIRPIVILLAIPLGSAFVFLLGLFANTIALMITANLMPSFSITNWGTAFLGSFIFSTINIILTNILTIDDHNSFYQGLIERLAKRRMYQLEDTAKRGLVMLEIDGLSYHHMKKAIEDGVMPNIKQMIDEDGYLLSRVDCGLPSQTSACQSGIMFGDNYDIPAFRWFDKDLDKLMVSSKDASVINTRYAKGNGLMRSGTSINNMMNGDAQNSLLTLADLRGGSPEEKKQRAQDLYLLMLDPSFLMHTMILFFGDVIRELFQGFRQRIRNEQPRMNRLHKAYPFLRAATTIFMRDIAANLAKLEIIRGSPSIYLTWPGYDEVAHHSGPWTNDAFGTLKQYDEVIGNIRRIIQEKAPRPYELVILSDHGQSTGATFLQRYGYDLKEFIERKLPEGQKAMQVAGGDDGTPSMGAMAVELNNAQEAGVGGRIGKTMTRGAVNLLNKGANIRESNAVITEKASVTVCGSGNLAQIYFDLYPRKITLSELNNSYPGMVDALVNHDGVGFVVSYADDLSPIVLGKNGQHNLGNDLIIGEDPLSAYGEVDFRASQVRRVAEFPHSGDLIVMSSIYPDGSVAAMEELIGSHGGLGGEQPDAFIFHAMDMEVPETCNSSDVFTILNQRRGLTGAPPTPEKPKESVKDAWSLNTLVKGIARVNEWLPLLVGALSFRRNVLNKIAAEDILTGPAVLLALLGTIVFSMTLSSDANWLTVILQIGAWFITVLVMYLAARLLRGKSSYTSVLRVMGFAQGIYLLDILSIIAGIGSIVRFIVGLLVFIATWVGVATASKLKGFRTIILPVLYLSVFILGLVVIYSVFGGLSVTLDALKLDLGLR